MNRDREFQVYLEDQGHIRPTSRQVGVYETKATAPARTPNMAKPAFRPAAPAVGTGLNVAVVLAAGLPPVEEAWPGLLPEVLLV
jgi:hypothetical protein